MCSYRLASENVRCCPILMTYPSCCCFFALVRVLRNYDSFSSFCCVIYLFGELAKKQTHTAFVRSIECSQDLDLNKIALEYVSTTSIVSYELWGEIYSNFYLFVE